MYVSFIINYDEINKNDMPGLIAHNIRCTQMVILSSL